MTEGDTSTCEGRVGSAAMPATNRSGIIFAWEEESPGLGGGSYHADRMNGPEQGEKETAIAKNLGGDSLPTMRVWYLFT
jgi:hypothetical protein